MGWLTPLIPHISGGRRGRRWRIGPAPDTHGEWMGFEVGDGPALWMEREWRHPEEALNRVFDQREWAIENKRRGLARREALEARVKVRDAHKPPWRKVVADPDVNFYWVSTSNGQFRHVTSSPLIRSQQYRRTACGQGWMVHQCSVSELQRLPPCPHCIRALDEGQQEDFLMKEAGR